MPVSVIIPAYRAAASVAQTVGAAKSIPGVSEVIVVDDGSRDGTAEAAGRAGADLVIALPGNVGKGGALMAGIEVAHSDLLLFLDADLGASASHAGPLLDAARQQGSMAIAVFPSRSSAGGFGLARGLAHAAIRLLGGLTVAAPLSGQRALPARLVKHIGLASRFGAETGLTVEAAHLSFPIRELALSLEHEPTGRTFAGLWHRGRQCRDILWFTLLVGYGLGWPALPAAQRAARMASWAFALALVLLCGAFLSPSCLAVLAVVAACGTLAWLPLLWVGAVWLNLRKANYLGRSLPAGAGLVLPLVALPALALLPAAVQHRGAAAVVIGTLGAVGLLDDLFAARRQARGLRGHLRSLRRGRLTTGAVKALGGLAAGLLAGALLSPGQPAVALLDALLIALTANSINLLDLRPSRALKGFGLICVLAIGLSPGAFPLLGPLLVLAVVAAPAEFAGRVMLGDVGSNVLGGAAGLGLAIALPSWGRLVAVALLALVHLVCERWSLSDVIPRNRVLRAFDEVGTAHLPPLPPAAETGP